MVSEQFPSVKLQWCYLQREPTVLPRLHQLLFWLEFLVCSSVFSIKRRAPFNPRFASVAFGHNQSRLRGRLLGKSLFSSSQVLARLIIILIIFSIVHCFGSLRYIVQLWNDLQYHARLWESISDLKLQLHL